MQARIRYCCAKYFSLGIQEEPSGALCLFTPQNRGFCVLSEDEFWWKQMPNHGTTIRPAELLKKSRLFLLPSLSQSFLSLQKPPHNCSTSICMTLWELYWKNCIFFFPGAVFQLDRFSDLVHHVATQIFMMAQYNRLSGRRCGSGRKWELLYGQSCSLKRVPNCSLKKKGRAVGWHIWEGSWGMCIIPQKWKQLQMSNGAITGGKIS